ncbi:MAG: prepilin-type N-terminal cleavage/methylation domain-containing protein [Synergistaceae bacterium]|nr:prepilin-type N-terminal cleavage/methylation domain-containing protein [Synergistaceae bacterium]
MKKGFTLVEIIIVLVVIGILSAGMMIGADEAATTAKATKIITDMQTLRDAAIAWYIDNKHNIIMTGDDSKRYAIRTGTNTQEDIQTYFSGYGKLKRAAQQEFRRYFEGGVSIQRINVSNLSGYYGTEKAGDYALLNNKHITDQKPFNKDWYVACCVANKDSENKKLKNKLKGRAEASGLIGKGGKTYNGENFVFMFVLNLGK